MSWISALVGKLKRLLTGRAFRLAAQAVELVDEALPIVEQFARATPHKTDDELVALLRTHQVPVSQALADGTLSADEIKAALCWAAGVLLRRRFPEITATQAHVAVNLAYLRFQQEAGR